MKKTIAFLVSLVGSMAVIACSSTDSGNDGETGDAGAGGSAGTSAQGGSAGTSAQGGSAGTSAQGGSAGSAQGGSAGTSAQGGSAGSSAVEPSGQLSGIVAAHNAARASVSPPAATPIPPLTWSDAVAAKAAAWAAQCKFGHNPALGSLNLGENIYAGTGKATPEGVVKSWVSEVKDYDYATNKCSGTCGHYTQVVWAKSLELGCAVQQCTTGSPFGSSGAWELWVCDYSPPGNFNGEKPY